MLCKNIYCSLIMINPHNWKFSWKMYILKLMLLLSQHHFLFKLWFIFHHYVRPLFIVCDNSSPTAKYAMNMVELYGLYVTGRKGVNLLSALIVANTWAYRYVYYILYKYHFLQTNSIWAHLSIYIFIAMEL